MIPCRPSLFVTEDSSYKLKKKKKRKEKLTVKEIR